MSCNIHKKARMIKNLLPFPSVKQRNKQNEMKVHDRKSGRISMH